MFDTFVRELSDGEELVLEGGTPGGPLGFHGDVRYCCTLTDPEPDGEFDLDVGNLDYWRATAGVTFRS
jgi:hypothetical protein